jgi:tetratricopeptide (TPR) repeat protein
MRLLPLLFALILLVPSARAADPDPAKLPEKVDMGNNHWRYPAEAARRIQAGKTLLDAGNLDGAKEEFDKAEKADWDQPSVYFYQAVVAYRQGDYERAANRAKEGSGVVFDHVAHGDNTAEDQADSKRFDELTQAIADKAKTVASESTATRKRAEYDAALKEGDEAYSQGLLAKAAAAYAKAFRADRTQGEIGLRAAGLYADRLKNFLDAGILWQQVIAAGEPHATTARTEVQTHHDALDAVLTAGLERVRSGNQNHSTANGRPMLADPTEALRLAEAFPDSTELQVAIAIRYVWPGRIDDILAHLQAAVRLGLTPDEFLANKEFVEYLVRVGDQDAGARRFLAFVGDAYGDDTLGKIRTEVKRRADEIARLAREKAEKEQQEKTAKEFNELTRWRDARRNETLNAVNQLISARNGTEVEMVPANPTGKKRTERRTMLRYTSVSFEGGKYVFKFWQRATTIRLSTGSVSPTATEYLVSLPSLGSLSGVAVWPSSWESQLKRIGGADSTIYNLPADAGHRALCKELLLTFNGSPNIYRQTTVTYEYPTVDGSTGYNDSTSSDGVIEIPAMLTDEEAARAKSLLEKLGRLDAARTVGQLRQLRVNWAAWN